MSNRNFEAKAPTEKGWVWRRYECKLCSSEQSYNTTTRHFEEKHPKEMEEIKEEARKTIPDSWHNIPVTVRERFFELLVPPTN